MEIESTPHLLRVATLDDAPAITALVNEAFSIESFFKLGARTDLEDIHRHLASGEFLVVDADSSSPGAALAACVYIERHGADAYFGMLSIDPSRQGQGLGRLMIARVEERCREAGCEEVEIHVVDLREELPPFYRHLGYVETGTLPFPDFVPTSRPCHLIVMKKSLRAPA